MPAQRFGRSKYRCIGYLEEEAAAKAAAKAAKPRAPRKVLTSEEKELKKAEKEARDLAREKKKTWEDKLVPWAVSTFFRFPVGTKAMYKSDAKTAYGLTEKEILTLPHECIPCSPKTFFSQEDAKALSTRKFNAGLLENDLADQINARVFTKKDDDSRRRRANFHEGARHYMRY